MFIIENKSNDHSWDNHHSRDVHDEVHGDVTFRPVGQQLRSGCVRCVQFHFSQLLQIPTNNPNIRKYQQTNKKFFRIRTQDHSITYDSMVTIVLYTLCAWTMFRPIFCKNEFLNNLLGLFRSGCVHFQLCVRFQRNKKQKSKQKGKI
jgi:hypothetical protein